ncbi:hypothetical protein AJ81_09085 [Pseudothermotoga hypogea DSM 11164 = NBRC 106472]|uniref:DUF3298 domain-containing protein n=1 Tax=Pseudothermotoga hypogea DSM 11164 = NBRC 106472 TaxID=1123384 RepID=A0A0X1KUG2_9THEM|nr:DUF3298 and DUF4163 domain-containing protein [Pseudothermotoga hypogea]AJC74891.1 hypothetical protein AJ81_09085 [Pseudothermotoga hypogea DSM 11164 = NBRC 106472]MBC7122356.1 DUF3298 and DUF4163 domain-containing protein [Pseudothermotoga sp.]
MRKLLLIFFLFLPISVAVSLSFQGEFTDLIELKILEKRFENELIKVDLRIPWLKIAKDVEFSKSFNGEIEERFTLLVNRVLEDAKWVQNDPILSSSLPYSLWSRTIVTYLSGELLSCVIYVSHYTGGAHEHLNVFSYTVDLVERKILKLKDLFNDSFDYEGLMKQYLIEQFKSQPELFLPNAVDELRRLNVEQLAFTVSKVGLTLYFPPYVVSPFALGILDITIPWSKFQDGLKLSF